MAANSYYESLLHDVFSGRRLLVALDVLVEAGGVIVQLEQLGVEGCLAVGGSRGTGSIRSDIPTVDLGITGTSMMDGIRSTEAALENLPADALARIDAWDPDRQARVIRTLFSSGRSVAHRATFGPREARWIALEDKTRVDALWDAVGVPRAPSRIVELDSATAETVAEGLDEGAGTVWSGDNRSGWHGGGSYVRWAWRSSELPAIRRELGEACATARVMPFLEGIPCSIHGLVCGGDVVVFRPCELVVFTRPGRPEFVYAGTATFWDPSEGDRAEMRAIARRVGQHLASTVDYRGAFTVDGVMTRAGFRPTELNPRFGGGLVTMGRSLPTIPLYLLHLAVVEHPDLDWRPREFEALALAAFDTDRQGRANLIAPASVTPVEEEPIMLSDQPPRVARTGEVPDARLTIGPAVAGSFVGVEFVTDPPRGRPIAPTIAAILALADRRHGIGLSDLQAATDVRAPTR